MRHVILFFEMSLVSSRYVLNHLFNVGRLSKILLCVTFSFRLSDFVGFFRLTSKYLTRKAATFKIFVHVFLNLIGLRFRQFKASGGCWHAIQFDLRICVARSHNLVFI